MADLRRESLVRTAVCRQEKLLELNFTDHSGAPITVSVDVQTAAALLNVLGAFLAENTINGGPVLTKKPESFSVGRGRFEDVVLVKFEDDFPYALAQNQARQLARALLAEADQITTAPVQRRMS